MRTIAVSLCANPRCAPAESPGGEETGKSTDFKPRHPPSARTRGTAATVTPRLLIMECLQSPTAQQFYSSAGEPGSSSAFGFPSLVMKTDAPSGSAELVLRVGGCERQAL